MLNVAFSYSCAQCKYTECHYAECRYAECHGAVLSLPLQLGFPGREYIAQRMLLTEDDPEDHDVPDDGAGDHGAEDHRPADVSPHRHPESR